LSMTMESMALEKNFLIIGRLSRLSRMTQLPK